MSCFQSQQALLTSIIGVEERTAAQVLGKSARLPPSPQPINWPHWRELTSQAQTSGASL
ncbi:MAG: hypothetical protein AAF609_18255 [Cyanobacteria bacterium P01_C01_bin.120]